MTKEHRSRIYTPISKMWEYGVQISNQIPKKCTHLSSLKYYVTEVRPLIGCSIYVYKQLRSYLESDAHKKLPTRLWSDLESRCPTKVPMYLFKESLSINNNTFPWKDINTYLVNVSPSNQIENQLQITEWNSVLLM